MFVIEASERPIPHPQVRTLLWKSTASALRIKTQIECFESYYDTLGAKYIGKGFPLCLDLAVKTLGKTRYRAGLG